MIDREQVTDVVSACGVSGLAYLVMLVWLNGATVRELAAIARSNRHTVSDTLFSLELRGLVVRAQIGKSDRWFPSQRAVSFLRSFDGGNSAINAPTTTAALLPSPEKEAAAAAVDLDGGKTANKPPRLPAARVAALRAAGIGSNLHAELCALKWCTPGYIRAHDDYRRGRGESIGLLITRLRCGDAVPKAPTKADSMNRGVAEAWQRDLARSQPRVKRAG
jgi:hypothetical protein